MYWIGFCCEVWGRGRAIDGSKICVDWIKTGGGVGQSFLQSDYKCMLGIAFLTKHDQ